jgi:hypothetical protein
MTGKDKLRKFEIKFHLLNCQKNKILSIKIKDKNK